MCKESILCICDVFVCLPVYMCVRGQPNFGVRVQVIEFNILTPFASSLCCSELDQARGDERH